MDTTQKKTSKPLMGYDHILGLHANVLEERLGALTESYARAIAAGKLPVRSEYQKKWILTCVARIYGMPEKDLIGKTYREITEATSNQPNFPYMEMMGLICVMYSELIHMTLSDVHTEFSMSKRNLCRCVEKYRSLRGPDGEKAHMRYKFIKQQFLKLIF